MDAKRAFCTFCVCGITGVLVDIDHIISWSTKGLEGRFLHTPLLIFAGGIILITCAYLGRLYIKRLLRSKRENLPVK